MSTSPSLVRVVTATPRLTGEVRGYVEDVPPLLVSGSPAIAIELCGRLTRGGDREVVRRIGIFDLERPEELAGSAALVYVVKHGLTPADEHALRRADRQRLPIVCVLLEERPRDGRVLPYVRATDVVRTARIDDAAVETIAGRLAARAPEAAWALASRLPALREVVMASLAGRYSRQNAIVAGATFVSGADFPTLTLNQLRMTLRIAAAAGVDPKRAQALAVGSSLGGGLALRAIARRSSALLPLPRWAVQALVAYAGTRAIGLAAAAYAARSDGDVRSR